MENLYDVVIVGGGPAGLTAALYLARAKYRVLVLEKEQFGGQIAITHEVVNYPGIAKTSGKALTDTIQQQAEHFGAEFILAEATGFDLNGDIKTIRTNKGDYRCFGILLATGAHPRTVGFKGEEEHKGRGVAYCATCDGAFFRGRTVAVVGGGDVALEDAIYLARTCEKVYLIHRRDELRGAAVLQQELTALPNVEILYNHVVEEIRGEDAVESLRLRNLITQESKELPVAGIFVAVGIHPETELVRDLVACDAGGYVLAGEDCATNVPGLYVAGDIRKKPMRQIITAVADGANAAVSAGNYCK